MNSQTQVALRFKRTALACALGSAFVLGAAPASAMTFETENVKGSFDSTISFGMQWRMSGTSCHIIGNDNGGCVPTSGTLGEVVNGPSYGYTSDPDFNYLQADNGNLNFKKNQLVSAALKGNYELALKFRDGWAALGRFSWLYDPAADNTERTPLTNDAKDIAVHNITLLDAWVSKDLEVAGRPAKVKVGNQVLSWGEDIFIYGGINIINAIAEGVWYPIGGMYAGIQALVKIAEKLGVKFIYNMSVKKFQIEGSKVVAVETADGTIDRKYLCWQRRPAVYLSRVVTRIKRSEETRR